MSISDDFAIEVQKCGPHNDNETQLIDIHAISKIGPFHGNSIPKSKITDYRGNEFITTEEGQRTINFLDSYIDEYFIKEASPLNKHHIYRAEPIPSKFTIC